MGSNESAASVKSRPTHADFTYPAAAGVQVAGVLEGRLKRSVTIHLPGGPLLLSWSEQDNRVRITGPAQIAFEGLFDWQQYGLEEQK